MLTARGYDRRYYDEHREHGLDYAVYGDWQQRYGRWLVESLPWRGAHLLDVGCACGAIGQGLLAAGAGSLTGVDLCEAMIVEGRKRFGELSLEICDAAHLHLFGDQRFDGLHSAQVAEHWRPELVPYILAELLRVTRPGGLFFCCLDTVELYERQGRDALREDPTHLCIRPRAWWDDQARWAGWQDVTNAHRPHLADHPQSMLPLYDWDWFVCQRPEE